MGIPSVQASSVENSDDSCLCFCLALFHYISFSALIFFFIDCPPLVCALLLILFHQTYKVFLANPVANFSLKTLLSNVKTS